MDDHETLDATLAYGGGSVAADPPPEHGADPGQIGRFVVLRKLGEGGMGVVYAGYDNQLDRRLAIKLVRSAHARSEATRARVQREAQAMARLSHPNVVQVYEVGDHLGQIFVAMEFVTGPTLAEWASAHAPGPDRWRAMLDKYVDAARGLAAAHAAGIVHRDFKPANAMVGEDGRVRVLDFGIARAAGGDPSQTSQSEGRLLQTASGPIEASVDLLASPLTLTGAMVGTPAYMSPEQFEGAAVDARSDQFSFCVALYEAIYGVRPFTGATTAALVLAVVDGVLTPPPADVEVPSWIREVLLRGLAKDPRDRFASMQALIEALTLDPIARRRRWIRNSVAAGLAVAAIGGSVWFGTTQMRSADQAEANSEKAHRLAARARQRKAKAEAERDLAQRESEASATRARDVARVLAARELTGDPSAAVALLREVEDPEGTPGWRSAAIAALQWPLTEQVLTGHGDRIVDLDISRDDRWLASASVDETVRIWPLTASGVGAATILSHADSVVSVRFSPDSRSLLTASADRTAAVWPIPSGPSTILSGHTDALSSAEFSRDGALVVTGSRDGTARIWTLARPDAPITLPVTTAAVTYAEFTPDDRHVVVATSDGKASVWSVEAPTRPPMLLDGHRGSIGDADFSPRGDRVVTASADGTARVFALDHATATARVTAVLEHDAEVVEARFLADAEQIVTVSRDRSAKLWTLDAEGRVTGRRVFDDHAGAVWTAAPSPNLRLLALGGRDRAVEVWPLAGGPAIELLGHTADVPAIAFSHAGERVFTGSHDGTVRVWPTAWTSTGARLIGDGSPIPELLAHAGLLIGASEGGQVHAWRLDEPDSASPAPSAATRLDGHHGVVRLAVSGEPAVLVSGDAAGRVRVWPILDGPLGVEIGDPQRPLTLVTPAPDITALAIDADAELIAAETLAGGVYSWRLSGDRSHPVVTGPERLTQPRGSRHEPGLVAFAPDSRVLVTSGADRRVLVWQRDALIQGHAAGTERLLHSATGKVLAVGFSPDSRRLVVSQADRQLRVWTLDDLDAEPRVLEPATTVGRLAFSPDGRLLAGAGADGHVLVWTLDGDETTLDSLVGSSGEVSDVGFAPHGRELAAVSLDGTLRVWSLDDAGDWMRREPILLDAGEPLHRLRYLDEGRRIAVAGVGPTVRLWYLGERFDVESLRARLASASGVCLTAAQQMQWVGLTREQADAALAACSGTLEP